MREMQMLEKRSVFSSLKLHPPPPFSPLRWLRAAAAAAARRIAAARIRLDSAASAVHRRHHCYRRISRGSIVYCTAGSG